MKQNLDPASAQYIEEIIACKHQNNNKLLQLCQNLYEYSIKTNDNYAKAFALLYRSGAYMDLCQVEQCILYGQEAYQLQKESAYIDLLPIQDNILGCAFTDKGDFQNAMNYFHEGLQHARTSSDWFILCALLANTSRLYMLAGAFSHALPLLKESLEVYQQILDDTQKKQYSTLDYELNLFFLYLQMNDVDNAITSSQKCLTLSGKEPAVWADEAFWYYICSAKLLHIQKQPVQVILDTLMQAFASFNKNSECIDYFSAFQSYQQGLALLYTLLTQSDNDSASNQTKLIQLSLQELSHFYRIAFYVNLPYRWLQYDAIKIDFYEYLLSNAVSDSLKTQYSMQLLSTYQHYYEQCRLLDAENKAEQVARLTDLMTLFETRDKNDKNRSTTVRLKLESEQDALTGCANRFGLDHFMQTYFNYTKSARKTFACIIIDIDYFKQYNDAYGHLAGDTCIKTISTLLRKAQQDEGFLVRYGGDEFLLLYIDKTDSALLSIAEEIQKTIYEENIVHSASEVSDRITLTMGIVNAIPKEDETYNDFLHLADNALYQIKKTSKNNYLLIHSVDE